MNQYRETNELGVLGFCLMLLGYLTCGILSVPAIFICGYAMLREPKGLAIAGFVLSLPAVLGLLLVSMLFFIGAAATTAAKPRAKQMTVQQQLEWIK